MMIRTVSIWRWQLVFTGSIVAIAVMITAFKPQLLALPLFITGLALVVATTLLTFALPWHRMPRRAVVIIPLLDVLAVGFTTGAPDIRLGLLWVFPITWLATYFSMRWVLGGVGFSSLCLIVFADHTGEPADVLLRVLSVVVTLSFLGVTVRIGAQRARAARRLLVRRSEQVARAAERAETSQKRVTQIVDALGVALVVVADDGRILQMNDAYRALYGRDAEGEARPSVAVEYDRRRGSAVPPNRTTLARAADGELLQDERVWLFDGEGRWRALQVSTRPMAAITEGLGIMLVVIDDITEILEAAEERRTLTAVVSHELRNPLTAIIGHVDLLLDREDLPPEVLVQLRVVANASERMEGLVSSNLEVTRPAREEPFEPVDLREVVEDSAASFAPVIAGSRQVLDIGGVSGLVIDGDAFRLRQVMDNLLSNAVKYTAAGGRISVLLEATADGQAEVRIADTGTGIAADELARVFEPYFRADRAVHAGIAGTGLGMGIARDIVHAHDGIIQVESTVGEGTTVVLRFPRRRAKGGLQ